MRLIDFFDCGADLHPGRHRLHDGTSDEVRADTHRVASGLLAAGLASGAKTAVCSPNHAAAPAGLARQRLGGVKAPKSVDTVAGLPGSPVGKVLKKDLGASCRAGHERKI